MKISFMKALRRMGTFMTHAAYSIRKLNNMKTIWKGSIKLGLLNISINLYRVVEQNNMNHDMSDNGENRVKRIIANNDNELNWRNPAKSHILDGNYIML